MLTLQNNNIQFTNGKYIYNATITNDEIKLVESSSEESLTWDYSLFNLRLVNAAIIELKQGYNSH